jgi:hypothetical protein
MTISFVSWFVRNVSCKGVETKFFFQLQAGCNLVIHADWEFHLGCMQLTGN